jgi:hypothetical protein
MEYRDFWNEALPNVFLLQTESLFIDLLLPSKLEPEYKGSGLPP